MDDKKPNGVMVSRYTGVVVVMMTAVLSGCAVPWQFRSVRANPSRACMSLSLDSPSTISGLNTALHENMLSFSAEAGKGWPFQHETFETLGVQGALDGRGLSVRNAFVKSFGIKADLAKIEPAHIRRRTLVCPATLQLANGRTLDGHFRIYYPHGYNTDGVLVQWQANSDTSKRQRAVALQKKEKQYASMKAVCMAPSTLATAKPLITAQIIHLGFAFGQTRRQIENNLSLSFETAYGVPRPSGLPETRCVFKVSVNARPVYIPTVSVIKSAYGGTYVEVSAQ